MSIVTYNGVTLPYANITQFDQESVYDDSGTDRIYTRISVAVQCVINAKYLATIGGDLISSTGGTVTRQVTDDAAEIMKAIRQRLLQQRKEWSMTFNGVELIPFNSGLEGDVDAKNGPQPQACRVVQLTNVTFLLVWSCVGHFWENPNKDADGNIIVPSRNGPGATVLSNRWTEIQEIDGRNFTTYTRQGKYIIRSDNAQGQIVDDLREQMAVLAPYKGFLRETSSYKVSPDGLAMEYLIRDREQFKMPPVPAFKAEGSYTETATTPSLALRYGEVRIRLEGDLFTPQAVLLDKAIAIAVVRIATRQSQFPSPNGIAFGKIGIPQGASVKYDFYTNTVEVVMRTMYAADPFRIGGISAFSSLATTAPYSDTQQDPPPYLPAGSAGLLLHAAAYYDPNLVNVTLNEDGQLDEGVEPGRAGKFGE